MSVDLSSSKRCVVIVERDDLIRELLARWVTEAGYEVAIGGAPPPATALVVADVPDPRQAAAVVKELGARYGAPVLLTSGRFRFDVAASHEAARKFGVRRLLPKPFTREEFLVAVDETLRAR